MDVTWRYNNIDNIVFASEYYMYYGIIWKHIYFPILSGYFMIIRWCDECDVIIIK